MITLIPGDRVRITHLNRTGTIVRVSERLRRAPYLVQLDGESEARAFGADDLAKLDDAPVRAIQAGMVLRCGHCNSLNMGPQTCRACGRRWVR